MMLRSTVLIMLWLFAMSVSVAAQPARSAIGATLADIVDIPEHQRGAHGTLETSGIIITGANKFGPVARAGLAIGDRVLAIDGRTVGSFRDTMAVITAKEPGKTVSLEFTRRGETGTAIVEVGPLGPDGTWQPRKNNLEIEAAIRADLETLSGYARAFINAGRYQEALSSALEYESSIMQSTSESPLDKAQAIHYQVRTHAALGNRDEVERVERKIEKLLRSREGRTTILLGEYYADLARELNEEGNPWEAYRIGTKALQIFDEHIPSDSEHKATALGHIAAAYDNLMGPETALVYAQRAYDMLARLGAIGGRSTDKVKDFLAAAQLKATVHSNLKEYGIADDLLSTAWHGMRALRGDKDPSVRDIEFRLLRNAWRQGDAAKVAQRERDLLRHWQDIYRSQPVWHAFRLKEYGEFLFNFEQFRPAEKFLRNAIEALPATSQAAPRTYYSILSMLAYIDLYSGRFNEAEKGFRSVLALNTSAAPLPPAEIAFVNSGLGLLYNLQGEDDKALGHHRAAVQAVGSETVRRKQVLLRPRQDDLEQASAGGQIYLRRLLRLLATVPGGASPHASEAFLLAQTLDTSAVAVTLDRVRVRTGDGSSDVAQLVRRYQDATTRVRTAEKAYAARFESGADRDPGDRKALSAFLETARKELQGVLETLQRRYPDYSDLVRPTPLAVSEVQRLIGADDALIYFFTVSPRESSKREVSLHEVFAFVVTRETVQWQALKIAAADIKTAVERLRCGLDAALWATDDSARQCAALLAMPADLSTAPQTGDPLPFNPATAHALYRDVLGPLERSFKVKKQLRIVANGPLSQIPFQVLVTHQPGQSATLTDTRWLVSSQAVVVHPSVSVLRPAERRVDPSGGQLPYLGFGDPIFAGQPPGSASRSATTCAGLAPARTNTGPSAVVRRSQAPGKSALLGGRNDRSMLRKLEPLPDTAQEVCEVGAAFGAGEADIFLRERATEGAVKALNNGPRPLLERYRIIHFATHGLIAGNGSNLASGFSEPGLAFTPTPAKLAEDEFVDDGLLTATEVAELRLSADWVILSACNTAAGGASTAEAMSGLARSFFYAGARSLLVTHWSVSSAAAVTIVTNSIKLQNRAGLTRAIAFQRAIKALIDRGGETAHPSYWAPFTLVSAGTD